MTYQTCFGYASGKLSAMYSFNKTAIVLKSGLHTESRRHLIGYELDSELYVRYASTGKFMDRVRSKIQHLLGVRESRYLMAETSKELIAQLWPGNETLDDDDVPMERSVMFSLRGLAEQGEYLYLRLLGHQPYIPSVFSTCGHIYATESAPVTSSLDPDWHTGALSQYRPWAERRNIALQLLSIIKSLDTDFEEPIHFCDMKGINFGMTPKGQLKVIDVGTTYFKSFRERKTSWLKCNKHSDCDFLYCMGQCNFHRNKCEKKMANNNLQAACRVIFLPHWQNRYAGLLSQPPPHLASELNSVLDDCLNLTHERLSNASTVFRRLTSLLHGNSR